MTTTAFVGLGANLGRPQSQVKAAAIRLGEIPRASVCAISSLYLSSPMGVSESQPDYINAVVQLRTTLAADSLADSLFEIERQFGRMREKKNAAREIDLDLLLFGEIVLRTKRLILPHPRMSSRAFVLMPLVEIAGDISIPGEGSAKQLLAQCGGQKIRQLINGDENSGD